MGTTTSIGKINWNRIQTLGYPKHRPQDKRCKLWEILWKDRPRNSLSSKLESEDTSEMLGYKSVCPKIKIKSHMDEDNHRKPFKSSIYPSSPLNRCFASIVWQIWIWSPPVDIPRPRRDVYLAFHLEGSVHDWYVTVIPCLEVAHSRVNSYNGQGRRKMSRELPKENMGMTDAKCTSKTKSLFHW